MFRKREISKYVFFACSIPVIYKEHYCCLTPIAFSGCSIMKVLANKYMRNEGSDLLYPYSQSSVIILMILLKH